MKLNTQTREGVKVIAAFAGYILLTAITGRVLESYQFYAAAGIVWIFCAAAILPGLGFSGIVLKNAINRRSREST